MYLCLIRGWLCPDHSMPFVDIFCTQDFSCCHLYSYPMQTRMSSSKEKMSGKYFPSKDICYFIRNLAPPPITQEILFACNVFTRIVLFSFSYKMDNFFVSSKIIFLLLQASVVYFIWNQNLFGKFDIVNCYFCLGGHAFPFFIFQFSIWKWIFTWNLCFCMKSCFAFCMKSFPCPFLFYEI